MNVNGNRFYKELNCFCFISIHGIAKNPHNTLPISRVYIFSSGLFFSMRQMMIVSTADEDE